MLITGRRNYVVVSDMHLGMESEYIEKGINIPYRTRDIADKIRTLLDEYDADLVLMGDIKHSITMEGAPAVKLFFRLLSNYLIHIIPGNHDGGISRLVGVNVKVHSSRGTVIENTGLFHGHATPFEYVLAAPWLVMGHLHPSVLLRDRLGVSRNMPCWLKGTWKRKKVIVMPAFNSLIRGTPVNNFSGNTGPFLKNVDFERFRVYLTDGSYLGTVKSISHLTGIQ